MNSIISRLCEIGLGGQQGKRLKPVIAIARHRSGFYRQEGAAEAITGSMHLWTGMDIASMAAMTQSSR